MAANTPSTVTDEPLAETAMGFDVDGSAPWYAAKRTWAAVLITAVMVGEVVWLVRQRDPLAAQRSAVAGLDDAQKTQLAESWARFEKLTPDERERVHDLHAAIEADADPEKLRATLASYQKWKAGLSPQQSAALVGLSPPKRVDEVRKLAAEQKAVTDKWLSNEDVKKIFDWLEKQVEIAHDKILDAMPPGSRERYQNTPRKDRNWTLIWSITSIRGPQAARLDSLSQQAVAELRGELSPAAQRVFDAAPNAEARKQLMGDWIRQAAFRSSPFRDGGFASQVDEAKLQHFFKEELTESERSRYLALPREEMASQLKGEYLRRKGLLKEPIYGSGFGRYPFSRGPGGMNGPGGPTGPGGRDGRDGPGGGGDRRQQFGPGPGGPNNPPRDGFGNPPPPNDDGPPPPRNDNKPDPRDDNGPNKPPRPNGSQPPKPAT